MPIKWSDSIHGRKITLQVGDDFAFYIILLNGGSFAQSWLINLRDKFTILVVFDTSLADSQVI